MTSDVQPFPAPPAPPHGAAAWVLKRRNVLLFIGGFLFDVFTVSRIDSWLGLAAQLVYLGGLTGVLVGQHRESAGLWRPGPRAARLWSYNVAALHFFYGALLSKYVVLYARSASGLKPLVFFGLLVTLLVLNEMPAVRRIGHRLRLGLYAFCVASFLIYFLPVVLGRMGDAVFALSMLLAAGSAWLLTRGLAGTDRKKRLGLAWPAWAVLGGIALLYSLRLVPPVPLSVQFHGVYHEVRRENGAYVLHAVRPPFWRLWVRDDRPFLARPGDEAYYFARVFAPAHFHHRIVVRWEELDPDTGQFVTKSLAPILLSGGRAEGFRAFSIFKEIAPGLWRAGVETEDGRSVGRLTFRVVADGTDAPRRWLERRM